MKLPLNLVYPISRLLLWGINGTSDQRSQLGPAAELRNESEPNWAIGRESRRLGWIGMDGCAGTGTETEKVPQCQGIQLESELESHFSQSAVKNLPIYDPLKTKN